MKKCLHLALSSATVFLAFVSVAGFASETTRLQTLQVTAPEESIQTGEVVAEEHSGSQTRIARDQLTQYGKQLGVLLSLEAGIQQRQSGGFGTFSSVTIRGASGQHTAVYLDGILLNSGAEPVIDLSTLELLNLETVDIYRGTSPMQLGHGSIGGAVNLRSLTVKDGASSTARLGVGAFGQRELLFNHQGATQRWNWTAVASGRRGDNNFRFLNDNNTPLNPNDDAWQQRNNGQAERSSLLLKTGYQPAQSLRTDVLLQASQRTLGVPGLTNAPNNQARYDSDNTQLQLSQTIDQFHGWNSRHSVYQHTGSTHFDDRLGQSGLGRQAIESDMRTHGIKTYWERFIASGTLGLSLDYRRESLGSSDELSEDDSSSANRRQILSTAHLAWFDPTEKWMLAPAIRWLRIENRVNDGSTSTQTNPTSNTQISPQIGLSWQLNKHVSFSANAGRYFRQPSFGELYGSLGLINGNPLLQPEEGDNFDLGIRYERAGISLSISAFLARRSQMIVLSCDSRRVCRNENTGKTRVTGIELSTKWLINSELQLTSNATLQDPRNLDPNVGNFNEQLPGEARRNGHLRLQYKPASVAFWYDLQVNRERFYDTPNLRPAENTAVQSVGANWATNGWQVSAQLQNLANENIEDFIGLPKPGRVWSISAARTW